jgi:glycosyl-4,4'-diaponeurosporenoate acyltransferase
VSVLVDLAPGLLVLVNVLAWAAVHLGGAWVVTHLDARHFDPRAWLFRERAFEARGACYQRYFRVERWKRLLPDGAVLFRRGFPKARLRSKEPAYLARFRVETCRGELAHWLVVAAAPWFFLWNPPGAGAVMILYALVASLPFIVTQRYNRARLNRALAAHDAAPEGAVASRPAVPAAAPRRDPGARRDGVPRATGSEYGSAAPGAPSAG